MPPDDGWLPDERNALPRLAVFVDVQNVYYTVKEAFGRHFNYRAFLAELALQGEIVTAIAYAIDRGDQQQAQFQQILRELGFEVKLKPYIQRADGSAKGDWDVGITIDVMEQAAEVDSVVLVSGDGDFDRLLDRVRDKYQVNSRVYGVPQLTAASLVRAASEFRPIDEDLLLPKK